jgi:threonine dehydrogenase-like Zn-dependent dehydrogenase
MKAIRYEAPGSFEVDDLPMPPVGPDDVRIKINHDRPPPTGVLGGRPPAGYSRVRRAHRLRHARSRNTRPAPGRQCPGQVMGAGPTGLLLAQLVASGGATSVTVADIVAFKLQTAAALGADSKTSAPS